jgi:hypothetical protein
MLPHAAWPRHVTMQLPEPHVMSPHAPGDSQSTTQLKPCGHVKLPPVPWDRQVGVVCEKSHDVQSVGQLPPPWTTQKFSRHTRPDEQSIVE